MTTVVDAPAARMLAEMTERYGRPLTWGHSKVAHRDLGFCSHCVPPSPRNSDFGMATELSGWRLHSMATRGAL